MPSFAYLSTDLKCPFCDTILTDLLAFQWGFCSGYRPREKYIYQVKDRIYWKMCKDGSIPSWTYFDKSVEGNLGDPSVKNLIVRDSSHYWYSATCDTCKQDIGGAALKIIGGIIQQAWVYKIGELSNDTDIYIIAEDNSITPMPEWNDHAMTRLKDC